MDGTRSIEVAEYTTTYHAPDMTSNALASAFFTKDMYGYYGGERNLNGRLRVEDGLYDGV